MSFCDDFFAGFVSSSAFCFFPRGGPQTGFPLGLAPGIVRVEVAIDVLTSSGTVSSVFWQDADALGGSDDRCDGAALNLPGPEAAKQHRPYCIEPQHILRKHTRIVTVRTTVVSPTSARKL